MPYTRFSISKKYFNLGKEGVSTTALEKKQLNTPINSLILDDFRKACDQYNLKMNVVLEALMNEFIDAYSRVTSIGILIDCNTSGGKNKNSTKIVKILLDK